MRIGIFLIIAPRADVSLYDIRSAIRRSLLCDLIQPASYHFGIFLGRLRGPKRNRLSLPHVAPGGPQRSFPILLGRGEPFDGAGVAASDATPIHPARQLSFAD
jgi:hypothetical protein